MLLFHLFFAAQLKVNLRPLYAAVHAAFATITSSHLAPLIWSLIFAELASAASGEMVESAGPQWEIEMQDWDGQQEVIVEDIKTFRDPPRTRREELLSVELRRDTGVLFEQIQEVRSLRLREDHILRLTPSIFVI